ncbi:MAG: hypothetical protein HYT31_00130 [Parcubacteria group bacterium]|nr:hypothetical protein [Parcubacteria group bacterium]
MEQLLTPLARIRLACALGLRSAALDYLPAELGFLDTNEGAAVSDVYALRQASKHGLDLSTLTWPVPNEDSFVAACRHSAAIEAASA